MTEFFHAFVILRDRTEELFLEDLSQNDLQTLFLNPLRGEKLQTAIRTIYLYDLANVRIIRTSLPRRDFIKQFLQEEAERIRQIELARNVQIPSSAHAPADSILKKVGEDVTSAFVTGTPWIVTKNKKKLLYIIVTVASGLILFGVLNYFR